MHRGAKFFKLLLDADAPFVILENPAMHRYGTAAIGGLRPSQYIHPFEHGHGETKSIGIYADGLPLLTATKLVAGRTHVRASLPQSPQRSAIRGRTYLGVAAAMALQWTPVLAQYVGEQQDGIRSKDNDLSAFDLCVAAANRLECPLSVRSEHVDQHGTLCAANITIPEEHDDTDAGIAAATLIASTTEGDAARKREWMCKHDCGHSLDGPATY
jgi:hypothetical protein